MSSTKRQLAVSLNAEAEGSGFLTKQALLKKNLKNHPKIHFPQKSSILRRLKACEKNTPVKLSVKIILYRQIWQPFLLCLLMLLSITMLSQ